MIYVPKLGIVQVFADDVGIALRRLRDLIKKIRFFLRIAPFRD